MSTPRTDARRISVTEAARIIGVTRGYVRMLADMGRLRAKRGTFGIRLFDSAAVKRWLTASGSSGGPELPALPIPCSRARAAGMAA